MPESYHSSYTQADILKAKLRASGEVQSIAMTHSIQQKVSVGTFWILWRAGCYKSPCCEIQQPSVTGIVLLEHSYQDLHLQTFSIKEEAGLSQDNELWPLLASEWKTTSLTQRSDLCPFG